MPMLIYISCNFTFPWGKKTSIFSPTYPYNDINVHRHIIIFFYYFFIYFILNISPYFVGERRGKGVEKQDDFFLSFIFFYFTRLILFLQFYA